MLNLFQPVTLPLIDMVVPAPRIRRPFEELSQPFSTSCSKLCNHPIDPDRHQDFHLNLETDPIKTLLLPDEELQIREELERLADDDGTPPSSMSSRHSHEDDEDKMPEEAFMKYTKDSRTVTPIPVKDDAAPDQQSSAEKKPIKVDMRDSVEDGVKDDVQQGSKQTAPTSASTPRRPAPRGPAIQKQRGGPTK